MAYDEKLAERVRDAIAAQAGVSERKMFGGLCFMVHGNMACGIVRDELMVRVAPEDYEQALAQPHAREMDFTGRPMKGMLYVSTEGLRSPAGLRTWVARGAEFAAGLPPKVPKAPKTASKPKRTR